jgi:hypothetical protein
MAGADTATRGWVEEHLVPAHTRCCGAGSSACGTCPCRLTRTDTADVNFHPGVDGVRAREGDLDHPQFVPYADGERRNIQR